MQQTSKALLFMAASLLGSPALPGMASAQTTNPNIAAGASLYTDHCAKCHMANGAGGKMFGTVTSADLRAPGLEKTYHNSDNLILRAIMDDKDEDGDTLDKPMHAWKGKLTVAQARDIIAYLHTLHS
ncbi:MAG TPA: cytochrome c [Acidocella sp.]|nr:cytochrome c [Acidocella sp.]